MDIAPHPPRKPRDSSVPMINIVFLLLVFFLLTATLATRAPFPLSLPESRAEARAEVDRALFVSAEGRVALGEAEGEAAYEAVASRVAEGQTRIELRADRRVAGPAVARILARLGALGMAEVDLVVGPS